MGVGPPTMCILEIKLRLPGKRLYVLGPPIDLAGTLRSTVGIYWNIFQECFHTPPRGSGQEFISDYSLQLAIIILLCTYGKTCFCYMHLVLVIHFAQVTLFYSSEYKQSDTTNKATA